MRHLRGRASFGALLSAAALLIGNAVQADIIPVFNADTPIAGGCEFSYNVSVASGSRVNTGDYFTIYDFNGYIAGSAFAPADWAITDTLFIGVTPAGVDPSAFSGDSPAVLNLTFTYTGAGTIFGPADLGVGAFGADSTFCGVKVDGTYASNAHKNNPGHIDDNSRQANGGFLPTPNVPETSSLMLLVPGLVPLGMMLRRRARK